jgi:hypothetical protein
VWCGINVVIQLPDDWLKVNLFFLMIWLKYTSFCFDDLAQGTSFFFDDWLKVHLSLINKYVCLIIIISSSVPYSPGASQDTLT